MVSTSFVERDWRRVLSSPRVWGVAICFEHTGDRLPLYLGSPSALRGQRQMPPHVLFSLFFLPRLPIWFLVLDDRALPLTYKRQGGKINSNIGPHGV